MSTLTIKKQIPSSLPKDLHSEWNDLLSLLEETSHKPKIVIAGNVKAGKSTLANALLGSQDVFATGVVRTTAKNQKAETEHYLLIDTPGINANNEDTLEAEKAYKTSDLFLFVHNAVDGELLQQEVQFIEQLASFFPTKEKFWRKVIFVFTNAGQLEEQQLNSVISSIQKQVKQLLQQDTFPYFILDSLSYLKGLTEGKNLLMERSNVPKLLTALQEKSAELQLDMVKLKEERIQEKKDKLSSELLELIQQQNKLLGTEQQDLNIQNALLANLQAGNVKLRAKAKQLTDLLGSYQELSKLSVDPVYFSGSYSSGYEYSSEYQAERAAESHFRSSFYDRAIDMFVANRNDILRYYQGLVTYEQSTSNSLYKIKQQAEQKLNEAKEEIGNVLRTIEGIKFNNVSINLKVQPKPVKEANLLEPGPYLHSNRTGSLLELEGCGWYLKANIDTDYTTRYKSGFFGDKEVEIYNYNFRDAVRDLQQDITRSLRSVVSEVHRQCNTVYREFVNDTQVQANQVINELAKQLNQNEETVKKNIGNIKNRINKIDEKNKPFYQLIETVKGL